MGYISATAWLGVAAANDSGLSHRRVVALAGGVGYGPGMLARSLTAPLPLARSQQGFHKVFCGFFKAS